MFCSKCGSKSLEGAGFCQKCGAKLMADEAVSQTTAMPQHEPIASVSTITEDTQQAQVNGGLRKVANIGRVLLGISILLLLLCSLFSLPINPIIIVGGVAIGTILSALGLKRPFGMTKIIELVVACILLVAAIAYAVSFSGGRGDKYVQMVRGGILDGYPQKTVGEAFDDFLDNPKWESGVSEDGERFVNVKGGILYLNKEAELAVQFFVDEKNEAFQYNACEINGVPQNNLIFWGLLEAVYSNNPASTTGVPQNTSNENRIEVGETQTFDGRLEVTLEYVEFVSQIQSELVGAIFPEDGNIFLRATFTVRNIGTKQGGISPLLSTVTYDNSFEFDSNPYSEDGNITDVNPLAQPSTGSMSFEVSSIVAESDKSLVINISENVIGGDIMSFVVRPDANMSGESGTIPSNYDDAYNIAKAWLDAHPAMATPYEPTTIKEASDVMFVHNGKEYYRFYLNGYYWLDILVDSKTGELLCAVHEESDDPNPPEIIRLDDYYNKYFSDVPFGYEGNDEYAEIPATTTSEIIARDFVGTYSYDASFEDPTGGWNNFYYLLEIVMDGSNLVVTTSWRGMYIFDHVRVSPDSLTGNTLVFDAITNDSTEPQSHSITYIPAKDSPQGKDTIYIDGDETMPYVRE